MALAFWQPYAKSFGGPWSPRIPINAERYYDPCNGRCMGDIKRRKRCPFVCLSHASRERLVRQPCDSRRRVKYHVSSNERVKLLHGHPSCSLRRTLIFDDFAPQKLTPASVRRETLHDLRVISNLGRLGTLLGGKRRDVAVARQGQIYEVLVGMNSSSWCCTIWTLPTAPVLQLSDVWIHSIFHVPYFHETKSSATAEIARVGGRYAVQGHSRSPIFVPVEWYATSYYWRILTPSYILQRFQVILDWPNVCFVFNVLVRVDPKLAAMKFGAKKRDISLYRVVWNLFRYVWITSVTDGRTDGQTE